MSKIPIKSIDIPDGVRSASPKAVAKLVSSMSERGQLQPIRVRALGKRFVLVVGRHRLAAAERLGWTEIDAVIVEGDGESDALDQLVENVVRRGVTFQETAAAIEVLVASGVPQTAISRALGRSEPWVSNFRRSAKADPEALRIADEAQLAHSHVKAVVGLDPADQRRILQRAADGATTKETESAARHARGLVSRRVVVPTWTGGVHIALVTDRDMGQPVGRLTVEYASAGPGNSVIFDARGLRLLARRLEQLADALSVAA